MIILPPHTTDEAMEKMEKQTGMKRGEDFDRGEILPTNQPEKPVTLFDLYYKGNRQARRRAEAIMRKRK
jgi:hypothetical protein